jgi:hypothetical protein
MMGQTKFRRMLNLLQTKPPKRKPHNMNLEMLHLYG